MKTGFVMHLLQCHFDLSLEGLPPYLGIRTFPGTCTHVAPLSNPPMSFFLRLMPGPPGFLSYV